MSIARAPGRKSTSSKLLQIFQSHDQVGDGFVSSTVLTAVLHALNPERWNEQTVTLLLQSYGKSDDGRVNYADFFGWLTGDEWDLLRRSVSRGLQDVYEVEGSHLGSGSFGTVRRAVHRSTGAAAAVKSVRKMSGPGGEVQRRILDAEIAVLHRMDHPGIVRLHEVIEDAAFVHLAMELCLGGALLDAIIEDEDNKFTERQAAVLMRQIVAPISHMHARGACHRDLKLENFLLRDKCGAIDESIVKIVDFGLARWFTAGEPMTSKVGSRLYTAPEVSAGSYSQACDLWSCGVIVYILLCGRPPFQGKSDAELAASIRSGSVSFPLQDWGEVSDDAKNLIRRLLELDPSARLTAEEALEHVWMKNLAPAASSSALQLNELCSMQTFVQQNRLQKATRYWIAQRMKDSEIQHLRDMFEAMDHDHDGMVTFEQLRRVIEQQEGRQQGQPTLERNVTSMIENIERGGTCTGRINYTDFLAATLDKKHYQEERICWEAFQMFDRNGDGFISRQDLTQVLHSSEVETLLTSVVVDHILERHDTDGDGNIDFEDFLAMMQSS